MMEKKNAWLSYKKREEKAVFALNEDYKKFLTASKTERLAVKNTIEAAEKAGFVNLETLIAEGKTVKPGDKIYAVWMKKTAALFVIGEEPLCAGMNILGAHIDSPRLDIKQVPLYEDKEFAYLDTHYYGGIKKYQWVALPLAIYGVIVKKDGTVVDVAIGDKPGDPVLVITDLLPHLGADQMKKDAGRIIEGEDLNVMIGSRPLEGEEKEAVKAQLKKFFKDTYDIEEDDFLSAELEVVPAGETRDLGMDRSLVIGYGHDDRVCAYTSLRAILETEAPRKTSVCLLTDKEEVGSIGATGAQSFFFENTIAELLNLMGETNNLAVRRALANSRMISSDVSAGFDPIYPGVNEPKNSAYLGHGICFNKFTGARGKSGSNDANAEYVAVIRRVMEDNKVAFQTSELGKVDQGGGGTIAYISAKYGMCVIDAGVPVLSMHAPWEVVSKADVYEAVKCYKAFLKDA